MSTLVSISFSPLSRQRILDLPKHVHDVQQASAIHVVTANPEMLLAARGDGALQEVLQNAHHVICDGIGVQIMSWLTFQKAPSRVPGVDVMDHWLHYAGQTSKSVFLLGSSATAQEALIAKMKGQYPDMRISGFADLRVDTNGESDAHADVIKLLHKRQPDFCFVALGHGKQERWIVNHLIEFQPGSIVMGVGGSINFLAGVVKRAPCWMQKIGLEWVWRLIRQPWRFLRIARAVIMFPLAVIWSALFSQTHE